MKFLEAVCRQTNPTYGLAKGERAAFHGEFLRGTTWWFFLEANGEFFVSPKIFWRPDWPQFFS